MAMQLTVTNNETNQLKQFLALPEKRMKDNIEVPTFLHSALQRRERATFPPLARYA